MFDRNRAKIADVIARHAAVGGEGVAGAEEVRFLADSERIINGQLGSFAERVVERAVKNVRLSGVVSAI
jgi:hypothetical protein